jgi:hypothetical protein
VTIPAVDDKPIAPPRPALVALAVSAVAAVVYTWPLLPRFFTHLAGDSGDPYPLLWSMQVFRDELFSFHNPFFTRRAFYPEGVSLVFQTANWPGAFLVSPLWSFLPAVSVWNSDVLFEFTLCGLAAYLLIRELTGSFLAGVAAAAVFPILPYHMAHAAGHIHLIALGWLPLYLWLFHRTLVTPTTKNGVLAGAVLAIATLAAPYHLVDATVLSLGVLGLALWERRPILSKSYLRPAVALTGVFLVIAGPLLAAMLTQSAREPIGGIHDPNVFSLDLEAFALPNLISIWRGPGSACLRWTGNGAEIAGYLGYAMLALATFGAFARSPRQPNGHAVARTYLIAGAVGATLALGPHIHIGGRVTSAPGPYQLLALLPGIALSGVPARLACITYVGLVVAAGFGIAELARHASRWGRPAAIAATALAAVVPIIEYWPQPNASSQLPAPAPLSSWAKDPASFSVLDITGDYRMHWHALLHRKPLVGGTLSRCPYRLSGWYWSQPIIHDIERGPGSFELAAERVDPSINFDWGYGSPMLAVGPDDFRVSWRGTIEIPKTGEYTFFIGADDGATLALDGKEVTGVPGSHPYAEVERRLSLEAGSHPIQVEYEEIFGAASVRLGWSGPGFAREAPGPTVLRTPDGQPGLIGRYYRRVPTPELDEEAGRAALRSLGVRYVIAAGPNRECERDLQLPAEYRGEGVVIYRVP